MSNYFTISEFARLRNININSLRYYEKIGVLKPAYVDERTGYRYYSPEQLSILDVILLCIDFGMPLKDLTKYINNDEFIKNKELFITGKKIAQERINELQMDLDKIEYTLRYLNNNQQYCEVTGTYERTIPERTVVTMCYDGDLYDIRKIEMASAKLYEYAQEKHFTPVFPAGLLVRLDENYVKTKIFFEILGKNVSDDALYTISSGNYLCQQVDLNPKINLFDVIKDDFNACDKMEIIVSNMLLDKYQIGTKKSELQKRVQR